VDALSMKKAKHLHEHGVIDDKQLASISTDLGLMKKLPKKALK
jgi:hypothetical protein